MNPPQVTAQEWRAQVEKELAGAPFDKTLVGKTPEGISVLPLYAEGPQGEPPRIEAPAGPFRICARIAAGASQQDLAAEVEGGAEALWLTAGDTEAWLQGVDLEKHFVVADPGGASPLAVLEAIAARASGANVAGLVLGADPFGEIAAGLRAPSDLEGARTALAAAARFAGAHVAHATAVSVSTLPYHDAGADGADEIALALSTGVAYLETLLRAGLSPVAAAGTIAFRVSSGRDTFGELCKLRALRVVWGKVLAASGATDAPRARVHAVCSSRTLAQRDPWVNMLRVTTEIFAAVLGGADLITPATFDQALGATSTLGRRVARNTGLVLRDESSLGRVHDPASGSYYFDTLTDALAREAWKRFQAMEREGGIEPALTSGRLRARLEASWSTRRDLIARRKAPVLGVSEFANLDEKLPSPAGGHGASAPASQVAVVAHRDAEPFEELRLRGEATAARPEALLVALGPLAESRPRVAFASNFFGAGGVRVRETNLDEKADVACLCGSDARYAAEAVTRARALKAAGCRRVLLAGRPGDLEAALREAGVDGFLFVGCDAVALLSEILDTFR
jgi:methylmalonyl-CoA mutase